MIQDARAFWALVDRSGGPRACWPWRGHLQRRYGRTLRNASEYGRLVFNGKKQLAHRVAFLLKHGRFPKIGRHTCDNTWCANPLHVIDGTQRDNVRDSMRRGRWAIGERSPAAKLTDRLVVGARKRHAAGESYCALAREFGVNSATLWRACNGENWKHLAVANAK